MVVQPGGRALIRRGKRPSVEGSGAKEEARSSKTVEEVPTANGTDLAGAEHPGYGCGGKAVREVFCVVSRPPEQIGAPSVTGKDQSRVRSERLDKGPQLSTGCCRIAYLELDGSAHWYPVADGDPPLRGVDSQDGSDQEVSQLEGFTLFVDHDTDVEAATDQRAGSLVGRRDKIS